jgi:hypothetical protein
MMMKGMKMCAVHKTAMALVLIGALNWGLVGAFKFNLVMALLGSWPTVERLVYVLVGLSAVATAFAGKCCAKCEACGAPMGEMKKEMGGSPAPMQK